MARQGKNGRISGTLNNVVYRSYRKQQIIQGVPRRVRQTASSKLSSFEFGIAATQASNIRRIFLPLYGVPEKGMQNRLNATILKSITTGQKPVAERDLHDADLSGLRGFQFNLQAPFEKVLSVIPQLAIAENGSIHFSLPSFHAADGIAYPKHDSRLNAKLQLAVIAVDFRQDYCQVIAVHEFPIENHKDNVVEVDWNCAYQLPAGSIVLIGLGVKYSTIDWLGAEKDFADDRQNASGILNAFHVDEKMTGKALDDGLELPDHEQIPLGGSTMDIFRKAAHFQERLLEKGSEQKEEQQWKRFQTGK